MKLNLMHFNATVKKILADEIGIILEYAVCLYKILR